ncbi:ImmA/IrrE family metallo-endopeptidase [Rathayibacter tritici]|uniref:ImmA/IrrE family metallo-endopeptidase n=1 Tax=Rathayibacter tritici TaxID=33888 RepID=UPI001472C3F9|nr:ImmA/IrrE family metallo-endopeptidase [Rathayibacter tritici]
MVSLRINPDVLRWSMQESGLDVEEVARATARSRALVEQWLSGDELPTKGDVEKIGKRAGRSIQFYFLPGPPAQSPAVARFRSSFDRNETDPTAEVAAVRAAARMQKVVRWAADQTDSDTVQFPDVGNSPDAYALLMQSRIHWHTRTQVDATSKSALFKALRSHIEQLGVTVTLRSMGEKSCRGFSLSDPRAPLIAINRDYKLPSLRTYTLLHELAHIARGSSAVCFDEDTAEERWCEAFAASFLMPEAHLRAYFEYKHWTRVTVDQIDERIRLTSNRYKASWQSVAIRLRDLQLADQRVVDAVMNNSREVDNGFAPSSRPTPVRRLEEFGLTFTRAVLDLRQQDQLSEYDARRYLNVNGSQLSSLELIADGGA